ncbi:MAG: SOS response-associated peptidase [Alphaproteobacteria bacterium]|nr:SOS response-associated peptidase [Alphaproteobacteria bacterium]NNF23215.1 SOS response-associated peptidase [Paracoccaceae bacterium]
MCGRFAITLPPDAMAHLFEAQPANDLPHVPNYNVCPTNNVHVITSGDARRLVSMRWGFIPHWYKKPGDGPLLINARSETIAEKPAFRQACRERRCLVLGSGFFEWTTDEEGKKLPWYIYPTDAELVAFAGIWQDWSREDETIATCAIATTAAKGAMSKIHHRVPVMIAKEDWPLWLGENGKGAASLMTAPPEGSYAFHRVDPAVNSNRAVGAQLIEPV